MVVFEPFQAGVYLPREVVGDPGRARVGFMFRDASRSDPQVALQASWDQNLGWYLFFAPAGARDWSRFASNVRTAFTAGSNRQFGWFLTDGTPTSKQSFIAISRDTGDGPSVQDSVIFDLRNIGLQITTDPIEPPLVTLAGDVFTISKPSSSSITLFINGRVDGKQFVNASSTLTLPMAGAAQGTVRADFSLAPKNLEAAETGCYFFSAAPATPGEDAGLQALRYPLLRPRSSLPTTAQLDVVAATDPERSFITLPATDIPSYFVDTVGRTLQLRPQAGDGEGDDPGARLSFAPRPVVSLDDDGFYYLAPVGGFTIAGLETAGASPTRARILCGTGGTEYLDVALGTDALRFVANQPAHAVQRDAAAAGATTPGSFLDGMDGRAVTSWLALRVASPEAKYVSQPQQSPLYDPATSGTVGDTTVYLLAFRDSAAWTPPVALAEGEPVESPLVPMVPYTGVAAGPGLPLEGFLSLEADAINPARRAAFFAPGTPRGQPRSASVASADDGGKAMTPQGLLAGFTGSQWTSTDLAISRAGTLRFADMQEPIRQTLSQNQVFAVISRLAGQFSFAGVDQRLDIADWVFDLSPEGTPSPDGQAPVLILKLYDGRSIAELVADSSLWSFPDVFNADPAQTRTYVQGVIEDARLAVFGDGQTPDTRSIYYPFWQAVTSPDFTGLLSLDAVISLGEIPAAIRALLGGMTKTVDGERRSNVDAFRAHHVGIQINDTDPGSSTLQLSNSALFGLVDYERPAAEGAASAMPGGVDVLYAFEVGFVRALFQSSELREFSSQVDLTVNALFDVGVTLGAQGDGEGDGNVVSITGSYEAHGSSGDDESSGQGVYSFVAEGQFTFSFGDNPYLDALTFTKLQFAATDEAADAEAGAAEQTATVRSRFSIWGDLKFKQLDVLDLFSFDKLSFADMGIGMEYELTIPSSGQPRTTLPVLAFSPGNLRFDLAQSTTRKDDDSLLHLLPFRLKSFLYSEKADQTLEGLGFFALGIDAEGFDQPHSPSFKYALVFDLDLGTIGALVGSLDAFKLTTLIGWQPPEQGGGLLLGVQLPQADGKLEIKIEGVLTISIERFVLRYATNEGEGSGEGEGPSRLLVVALLESFIEVFGQRLPPDEQANIDFALFSPVGGDEKIGWIFAYDAEKSGGGGELALSPTREGSPVQREHRALAPAPAASDEGEGKVFELLYLGAGQRVGPDPEDPPKSFREFLGFMTKDFYEAFEAQDYTAVYHPDGQWLAVAHFKILDLVELGFVFYDVTPFYSLTIDVPQLFELEITYTKVSDDVGLFYIDLGLPDSLRQFNVGAVAVTIPKLAISIYTNGDFKLDVGFPQGDDWSRSFQLQAQAGPFPVTGSGGFYVAKLSSATSDVFQGDYDTILAFGLAARLGLGKDLVYGPLKAGVSVTFFGIIEGAAGWDVAGSGDALALFSAPKALSLKGELGIIGELYGAIDFKIITASVSVRLVGAIGVQIMVEEGRGGDILLYVRASVEVSAKASINLGLFKISISFKFSASIRLQWQLAAQGSTTARELAAFRARVPRALAQPQQFPRRPGLAAQLEGLFLPEYTVVFPAEGGLGAAFFACSLAVEYLVPPAGTKSVDPASYKTFETLTAQLTAWALERALEPRTDGADLIVTRAQLERLDQHPEQLVAGLDYATLVAYLGSLFGFELRGIGQPTGEGDGELSATPFPMFPFLTLATQGRLGSDGQPDELEYTFQSKNPVDSTYLDQTLADYFAQSQVNQQGVPPGASADRATLPLGQGVFQDYFQGLVRGAVDQLFQLMQDEGIESAAYDELFGRAVGQGNIRDLAGSMSNVFRAGVRLPDAGFSLPDGASAGPTVPLYSALWQQFEVRGLSPRPAAASDGTEPTASYTVTVTNDDPGQAWVTTADASYELTDVTVEPYRGIDSSTLRMPSVPVPVALLEQGPRSFAFQRAIVWSIEGETTTTRSLRPAPPALLSLLASRDAGIELQVSARETTGSAAPDGTPVVGADFGWATQVVIGVKQVPSGTTGSSAPAAHVYAVSGASQSDQGVLRNLLDALSGGIDPGIAGIEILYQAEAGAAGLRSVAQPTRIFVLRTNTTIDSLPPSRTFMLGELLAATEPAAVPVAATLEQVQQFLQIVEQASVTNQSGYDLFYSGDPAIDGGDLPAALFAGSSSASLTILVTYAGDAGNPRRFETWHNAAVFAAAADDLLYYATTTDPALDTLDVAVAAGSIGVAMTRDNSGARISAIEHPALAAAEPLAEPVDWAGAEARLREAGVPGGYARHRLVAESGGAVGTLDQIYSRISFQIETTTGAFEQGNVSVPFSPQTPDVAQQGDPNDGYRIFVPLYKRAVANVGLPYGAFLDRYASLGGAYQVDFWLDDAFGNQLSLGAPLTGKTAYFDNLVAVSEWAGTKLAYDFRGGAAGSRSLTVYVSGNPNTLVPQGLASMTPAERADALAGLIELYETIGDQLGGPGVGLYVETNLDPSDTEIPLDGAQATALRGYVADVLAFLQALVADPSTPFAIAPVDLTVTVPSAGGSLPELFAIGVQLGIRRDPALIDPQLVRDGEILYPRAQDVASSAPPRLDGIDLSTFAAQFVAAFPGLVMAISVDARPGAAQGTGARASARKRRLSALRQAGIPSDGSGSRDDLDAVWAVQHALVDIAVGAAEPLRYLAPKPLDTRLDSGDVALPQLPPLQLPPTRTFVDVDLDRQARTLFSSIDGMLAPISATRTYQLDPASYEAIARSREAIARRYSVAEVDWLFDYAARGDDPTELATDLAAARTAFEQQMRQSLLSAYAIDTIVQTKVVWNQPVDASVADRVSLFGQVQQTAGSLRAATAGDGSSTGDPFGLSTARVPVVPGAGGQVGLFGFTYGAPGISEAKQVELDLEYALTHIEYFLEPASETPVGQARPSLWLQLVDPYAGGTPPHIGTGKTIIPLILREYPTPPTTLTQSGIRDDASADAGQDPLTTASSWSFAYRYQAQITAHDEVVSEITYNTDLSVSNARGAQAAMLAASGFTLFESLVRFTAALEQLQPVLEAGTSPAAVEAYATLATQLADNTTWTGTQTPAARAASGGSLGTVTDAYTITDVVETTVAAEQQRLITLCPGTVSWPHAAIGIEAIDVSRKPPRPYPDQQQGSDGGCVTDRYVADIVDDWVTHQVTVEGLDVRVTENGLAGVLLRRNAVPVAGLVPRAEFIYSTPMVRFTQPTTPFLDVATAIDIAALPDQRGTTLEQRIETLLQDLLAAGEGHAALREHVAAKQRRRAGLDVDAADEPQQRLAIAADFRFSQPTAIGGASTVALASDFPVLLARSFDLSLRDQGQTIPALAALLAAQIDAWATGNGVAYGTGARPTGAMLVLDITLYARLSSTNVPVLRLRNLQLQLADISATNPTTQDPNTRNQPS
jgi:hypothetical protein